MPLRNRKQRLTRRENVEYIVKKLQRRLSKQEDLRRAQFCQKRLCGGWVVSFIGYGRCFTKKLSQEVCSRLRVLLDMDLVVPPDEHKRLQALLMVARKRRLVNFVAKRALQTMSHVDVCETLPMEVRLKRYNVSSKLTLN